MLSARSQTKDRIMGLRAGSDEYVSKPIELDELTTHVAVLLERTRRLRQAPSPAALGRVIGFLGAKGGTGATTVLLNVAAALTQQKKTVVAVELRPGYGSFALYTKSHPPENLSHLLSLEPGANRRAPSAFAALCQCCWLQHARGSAGSLRIP